MGTMSHGMGGGMNRNFDFSSMLTVTDKDGKEVDVSELIGDITSIASAALSDGTTIALSSFDINVMRQLDLTKIVSITDKDGNVIDLSDYTISFSMGGMQRDNQSIRNDFDASDANENNPPSDIPTQRRGTQENNNAKDEPDSSSDSGQSVMHSRGNMNFDARSGVVSGNPAGSSDAAKWILVGASVVVLAAGLFIAIKKKY